MKDGLQSEWYAADPCVLRCIFTLSRCPSVPAPTNVARHLLILAHADLQRLPRRLAACSSAHRGCSVMQGHIPSHTSAP